MTSSPDLPWMQRARSLTQALIISGTLNIGLISSFIYFLLKDSRAVVSLQVQASPSSVASATNDRVLAAYSKASFRELLIRLENCDLVEEGYSKRDLALACLFSFHHFDVERALGGIALQKRVLAFRSPSGDEQIGLPVFPGLTDEHFEALMHFAGTEKWPFTPKGLFFEVKRGAVPLDPELLESFYLTSEFNCMEGLFRKSTPWLTRELLVGLLKEGSWESFKSLADRLRTLQSYDDDTAKEFLIACALEGNSKTAAGYLLQHESDYVLKKLSDARLISFLDLSGDPLEKVASMAKELLVSPRSDLIRRKAASVLYAGVKEMMPEPFDYKAALIRFVPEKIIKPRVVVAQPAVVTPAVARSKNVHKVVAGDSLWKIARKYKVSVESIMKVNRLETDRLKLGKELQIPESKT